MTTLKSNDPSLADQQLETVRYLIVLVPSLETDFSAMAHRVWELTGVSNTHVFFLGLYVDPAQEPRLRRELVTVSAMVNDGCVAVETDAVFGNNWVDVVRTHTRTGDTVVCLAEQRAGFLRKPLSQILQSELDLPLYILSGTYSTGGTYSMVTSRVVAWAGFIALLSGFFLLQIKITDLIHGSAQVALMSLSVVCECGLIWIWNNRCS